MTASHGGCRKKRRKPLPLLRLPRETEEANVVGEEGIEGVSDVVAQKEETRAIRPLQQPTVQEVHTDRIHNQEEAMLPALRVKAGLLEEVALDD